MGIIEPVVVSDDTSNFLPHHSVPREDKETTRLREVFDGSAKATKDDLSFNDCHEKCPNLALTLILGPDEQRMSKWLDTLFHQTSCSRCHETVHHDGIRETLSFVRGKHWILCDC